MTNFDCTDIVDEMVVVPGVTKICCMKKCYLANRPQPIKNFYKDKHQSDGLHNSCKECVKKQQQQLKDWRKVADLKTHDIDGFNTTVSCMYVECFHTTEKATSRILSATKITKEELDDIVKSEGLLDWKVCRDCGKLKPFTEYFKKTNGLAPACKLCNQLLTNTDEYRAKNRKYQHAELRQNYTKKYNSDPVNKQRKHTNAINPVKYDDYVDKLFADVCRKSLTNQTTLEVQCAYCGRFFEPTQRQVRIRINSISDNPSRTIDQKFYCSDKCRKTCPIYGRSFEELLRMDQSIVTGDIPTNREVQPELRQMVLARDNYTCVKCGKHQDDLDVGLHAHHIEGIRWESIESADIDRVITLCVDCHHAVHKIPGCSTYDMRCNLEDRDEDTLNKIKKNKEIKKQDIDKVEDIEINISDEILEDFLLD